MAEDKPWWEHDLVQSAARGADRLVELSKQIPIFGGIIRGLDEGGQAVNAGDWSGAARNYGSALGGMALAGLGGATAALMGRGALAGVGALRAGAGARAAGIAAGQAGRGALSSGLSGRAALGVGTGGGILSSLAPGQSPALPPLTLSGSASPTAGQMSSWERAMTGGGGGSLGEQIRQRMMAQAQPAGAAASAAQPTVPSFSDAIRGLNTAQQEYFDNLVSGQEQQMRRRLSDLDRQEEEARLQTGRRVRQSRALGAGSAADLRAAAAGRGLLSSPAAFEVGTEYLAGQSALEQAQARGQLDRLLQESSRARADERAQFEQFMQNVRRERLRQQQANEQEFMNRLIQSQQMYFG